MERGSQQRCLAEKELSQTADKSKRGKPDGAGQPLEAAAEGQVSQLLPRAMRGGGRGQQPSSSGLEFWLELGRGLN